MPARRPPDTTQSRAEPRPARRQATPLGDDAGVLELAQRVSKNLRERRKARGMSLDELSQACGVSRAALSQIETCKTNPTVGVLWKIAVGLGIPFAELVGEPRTGVSILRRADVQPLLSRDRKFESRALSPPGSSPLVELYELRLAPRAAHVSEPHATGTWELLVMLSGQLRLRLDGEKYELAAGDSITFEADRPHVYENPGAAEARYHNIIAYQR
ncbi:MAG: helix-turn-helix domain-containing protein [Deltaproteobacteria bacterium]|nr:helix-turn-helix domain-containing protein [Deltaproteobacteria bacterium]